MNYNQQYQMQQNRMPQNQMQQNNYMQPQNQHQMSAINALNELRENLKKRGAKTIRGIEQGRHLK